MKHLFVMVAVMIGCGAAAARAQDGAWAADADGQWSDSINWAGSIVAGNGGTAYFTNTVTAPRTTVEVDAPVTLGALRFGLSGASTWRLIGSGPLILEGETAKPRIAGAAGQTQLIFTPLVGEDGFVQESGSLELAGKNDSLAGLPELKAYTVTTTMSKSADSEAELARDYFPKDGVIIGGGEFALLGRKNAAAASSEWELEQGSPIARAITPASAAALTPGQAVSGASVPAGAFIRQILDDATLELSAAAEQSGTEGLTFAAASFHSEQLLRRVRLDSERNFMLNANSGASLTVDVERVYGTADWALKNGGGAVLKLPGQREHSGTIKLHNADLALASKTVVRQPAAGAAFHVDASRTDTLVMGSGNEVDEWHDANGGALHAKAPGPKPTLMAGALNGLPVVDFSIYGSGQFMHWFNADGQTELTDIHTVFWVLGSQNGGGFLLGSDTAAHFHRGGTPAGTFDPSQVSSMLWGHDWNTYPGGGRVQTFVDGIPGGPTTALNSGYQVISCVVTTNTTAGGFALDRSTFPSRRGGQRLAEVIIYNRVLTELERIETEEYLTAKWFGDTRWDAGGRDPYVTALDAAGTRALDAPDSGVTTIRHLSGTGTLTKRGAGDLALDDAAGYSGHLKLAEGGLLLTAAAIPDTPADGAYFHVDASATDSFALDGDGNILAWKDWRGNGLEAAVDAGALAPSLRVESARGLPMVDFGAIGGQRSLAWNHTNNTIQAVFVVWQSLDASAQLLGGVEGQPQDFFRGANGVFFHATDITASRAVAYGAVHLNGRKIVPTAEVAPTDICVVSVVPTTPARASAFARDRQNASRSGGQRLAEVIVYDRALTEQERQDTEAYLMRKWLGRAAPGYGSADTSRLRTLSTSAAELEVTVDGEGVATIEELTGGGTVVKRGTGTLGFGTGALGFAGAVTIAEGAVALHGAAGDTPAPAPVFHVDASRRETLTLVPENGTNFISRWESLAAAPNAAAERSGYALPFLREDGLGGLPVVDFGLFGITNGACLKWDTTVTTIRSVFLVLGSQEGGHYVLGAQSAANFHRGPNPSSVLLPITRRNKLYGYDVSANVANGKTYLDGVRVANPSASELSGGYQVVEVLTTGNTTADLFAGDRNTFPDRTGGQRLAEVIIYDRLLTEQERIQTENYLFAKWFGRAPVYAGLGTMHVADGTGITVESAPAVVNKLQGAGTVVKDGAGVLTLTDLDTFEGVIEVVGGTLNLAVPPTPLAPPAGTLFWLDASCAGTLDTDLSGGVTEWRDVTGNGRYASPVAGRALPTLRGSDFTGRAVVDLGPYGFSNATGMHWNEQIGGMKTIAWVLGSQSSGGYLLGGKNGAPFHRGRPPDGGQIDMATFSHLNNILGWDAIVPAAAYTNGVPINAFETPFSGGYQIIVMTWTGGTWADGFAFDRTFSDRYGGQRLAEFIAYDRVLDEEDRLALEAYLGQKWFGEAHTAGRPAAQAGVILHEDTTLTMNNTEQAVTTLSGAGRVADGTLVVTEALSPDGADGAPTTLTVDGDLVLADDTRLDIDADGALADNVTVSGTLTLEGGGSVAMRGTSFLRGKIALITFGTLTGAEHLSTWRVTGLPSGYSGRLDASGDTLYLSVFGQGTVIHLR